jgi:hypothetical protein
MSTDGKIGEVSLPTVEVKESEGVSRRGFLGGVSSLAAAATLGSVGAATLAAPVVAEAEELGPINPNQRRARAFLTRQKAALNQFLRPLPSHVANNDEQIYGDLRAQYSKGLPHNALGEVTPAAYAALRTAVDSGNNADYEAIPLGGVRKQVSPQAALAFEMTGPDSHHVTIPPAPAFASAWEAGEMVELYWQALTRDVKFENYATDPDINAAVADMNAMSDFRGPKQGGQVTAQTLFRGFPSGDLVGPYISQLLWLTIPYGMIAIPQKYNMIADGDDRGITYADWLAIQNGTVPAPGANLPGPNRYIITGRDLAQYDHFDFSYQAFLNAALILLGLGGGALDDGNPYKTSVSQAGFSTLGGPDVLDLVAKAGNAGLKAAWYQKWQVHRRLRPEVFGGRVHNQLTGAKNYGIHPDVLNSAAVAEAFSRQGTYLLAQAYPEGSPTHPAYPAGHATISGACTTVLKAFFKESFVLPAPVVPSADGSALLPYGGGSLTVGGELDKLASNISLGRDTAGVHWRTDGDEGMRLGEKVGLGILRDYKLGYNENVTFTVTTFDGATVTI